ncbi:MAG: DNA polymerase III subunit beta [Firmicutes bacterium]|nr:DNA polymerase III subunit beta [Bacillota bacterium]
MHLVLNKNELLENLPSLEKIIPTRTTIPLLKGVRLETDDHRFILTSNNLEMSLQATYEAKVQQEGSVILPEKFFDIIRQSPAEEIEIEMLPGSFRTSIKSGTADFFLYGADPEQFPLSTAEQLWKKWTKISFVAGELKNILQKVHFAASQDESKPSFKGILLEIKTDHLLCMASDTYRLACLQKSFPKEIVSLPYRLLIPGKTLGEVGRMLTDTGEDVDCYFQENEIIFVYKHLVFSSRLLQDQYPDLQQAFPEGYTTKIKVDTKLLENTVNRASLLAEGENRIISLGIQDTVLQVSSDSELGKMKEEITLQEKEGDDLAEILLNSRFLLDALRIWETEEVEIEFNGPVGACIFNHRREGEGEENYRYLVLPIKKPENVHDF